MDVFVQDKDLRNAAEKGMDDFLACIVEAIDNAVGGELNAQALEILNADQITLLAYRILRDEVMDGGFVQLIHNGYGGFIYLNPFKTVMRQWGIEQVVKVIAKTHSLFKRYGNEIEQACDDETFMAMFEKYPQFDEFDDYFVEHEEEMTAQVACYVDEHLDRFVTVVDDEQCDNNS